MNIYSGPGIKQIMVRVTPELLEELEADAHENERTVSQTVRLACRLYLESGR